ncbi:FtsH protease activity modulator HflK [Solimicrobium silvestre]|uniref:Protein HflK n=1 Tax=Solimicrobium silvestre TaxID=2099400 RepID=A0A2S9GW34_9BURK|nr:FtsH protease activity modulator HflK [Solimicrobium silvestre]PRC91908.1 hflK: HflK protein [Solimicrobium silvestre]
MVVSLLKKMGAIFSLNDPKWGRGSGNENDGNKPNTPSNGPPDLEDLWRDFNQKLNTMFGGKGAGSGGGRSPDSNGAKMGAGLIVIILLLLWLISGSFVVQEGQTGVVMTFGKFSHETTSGFNWRLPYPIQSHEIVNVSQVRTAEVGYQSNAKNKQPKEALMLTDDENIIDIQFAVQYKLKSAPDWIFNNREQESTVKQVAETAIREVVGRNKMDFVLYGSREKVAFDVSQLIQEILDRYKSGVQVTNVTVQGVQPPEQVQAAFDDAVKAGQDRERQKNEGQAYANDVIPKARGAAARLQEESQAYQARVVANAEGNASRFKQVLTEYQKAPAVTRDRMYYETMQQIFTSTTKMMIDTKNGNNMIYLPLDKLIGQTLSPDAAAPKSVGIPPAQEVTNANDLLRARDNHSRDREGR